MTTVLYALAASSDGVPLAEAVVSSTKHAANAKKVFSGIKRPIVERKCLVHNGYVYDMLPYRDGTVYMCVTEESCNRALSFKFLDSVRNRCKLHRGNPTNLASELRKEVDFFNNSQNTKIREIRSGMADVKGEMIRNVDKLMERGDRLDALLLKSDALVGESTQFQENARAFKRQLLCKRILLYSIAGVVVLALLFFIILSICSKDGMNFNRCRHS